MQNRARREIVPEKPILGGMSTIPERVKYVADLTVWEHDLTKVRAVASVIRDAEYKEKGCRLDKEQVAILHKLLANPLWDVSNAVNEHDRMEKAKKLLQENGYTVNAPDESL